MRRQAWIRPKLGAIGVLIYIAVFAMGFGQRAWWTLKIQHPNDAVWSDMAGYVQRAEQLLAGVTPGEPRVLTIWPWGTHALIALEFAIFGRHSFVGIALCQAFVGAVAAPVAAALAGRFLRSRIAMLVAGGIVAFWHPHVVFSGYYTSEIWFSCTTLLATLFVVRYFERRRDRDAITAGVFIAIAFVVRPQVLLTVAIVTGVLVLARLLRARKLMLPRHAVVLLLLPLVLAIGFSSARFYRFNHRLGVISSNEAMQRLFGATDVRKLQSRWRGPDGKPWGWWFNPPTKGPPTPETTEVFEGFICDRDIIAAIEERRLQNVTVDTRLHRMVDNVLLLAVDNLPWPEKEAPRRMRVRMQERYGKAIFGVLALALPGLVPLRRHPLAALLVTAQLVTILIVAALYVGEARHRVPYDPLLIIVAVTGVGTIVAYAVRKTADLWWVSRTRR